MTSDWKGCIIGDICNSVSETYKGNDEQVVLINTSDVLEGAILNHSKVDNKNLKGQFKKTFKKNDILYSEIRPANKRFAFVNIEDTHNYIASTKLMVIRPDIDKVLPEYLYMLLKSQSLIDELQHLAETRSGTFPQITFSSELSQIEINLPPLETQRKIARVLGAIDDKIELNNSINKNLEQQAQAIFKSWFIDFEPFGGIKPDDWEIRTLDEFCNIFTGRKNANEFDENGRNKFFTCGPNPLTINSFIYDGKAIIISGNGAYTGRTRFYEGKFDLYQRTYACTPLDKEHEDFIYLFYIIVKNVLQRKIMGGTHGSAIPYIVMNDIAKFEINYNARIFESLSKIIKSIVNQILHYEEENERLTQLRDTLLPKLMSGEIDVDKVEVYL